MAREILITVPAARTYIIEDMRNGGDSKKPHGVVEIQYSNGIMRRRGLATTLPQLRAMGRRAWLQQHSYPTYFMVGKEKGKLGYYWKHVYGKAARSSREHAGSVVTSTHAYLSRRRTTVCLPKTISTSAGNTRRR